MSNKSKIEWTDTTWNPVRGCSIVSKGCANCYAMKFAHRFSGQGKAYEGLTKLTNGGPVWTGKIKLVPKLLDRPLHWQKPRRVFVNSMSDLFHEDVPFEFIASVFAVMSVTTRHTYQILTKRPQRMLEFFKWLDGHFNEHEIIDHSEIIFDHWPCPIPWVAQSNNKGGYDNCGPRYPYENVWIGVSVEDQKTADERIPLLLQTPAAVRWISAEPLLSSIDLNNLPSASGIGRYLDALSNAGVDPDAIIPHQLDWVVTGGESGPGARPAHPDWFRSLRDQCVAADVPFFFKQWGEWYGGVTNVTDKGPLRICRGGAVEHLDYNEHPDYFFMVGAEATVQRIGKKKAGRALDGQIWDQYPA